MQPAPPYTVEISSAAWRELALLPHDVYATVVSRLDGVARLASAGTLPSPGAEESWPAFHVRDLTLQYDVDIWHRVVRLLAVSKGRGPVTPEPDGTSDERLLG